MWFCVIYGVEIVFKMLPIVVHTRWFPLRDYHAITLFPFVFYKGKPLSERDLRHETVHIWQQVALLLVLFYVLYLIFWVINLARCRDGYRAYRAIPFERSAYALEGVRGLSWWRMAFDWLRRV